eukprot:CAMPEP_0115528500 /NCGR_PEP_ID=MMETSP0271-20121206/83427_1 /TAXON_ID=71861 /ORGANISM="Scrippsiella trochoidea, Strain CCMP3099" /LENGTH=246 /DNA_ID=CAMNT_0002960431 /DNA_START=111 /DNA_END=851 /DNA_ORIENTATION=+
MSGLSLLKALAASLGCTGLHNSRSSCNERTNPRILPLPRLSLCLAICLNSGLLKGVRIVMQGLRRRIAISQVKQMLVLHIIALPCLCFNGSAPRGILALVADILTRSHAITAPHHFCCHVLLDSPNLNLGTSGRFNAASFNLAARMARRVTQCVCIFSMKLRTIGDFRVQVITRDAQVFPILDVAGGFGGSMDALTVMYASIMTTAAPASTPAPATGLHVTVARMSGFCPTRLANHVDPRSSSRFR